MAILEEMDAIFQVLPIDDIYDAIGKSMQAKYIKAYLTRPEIAAKTIIIEDQYIDKDYLLDYSNYYARSFECIDKFTKRIHFFSYEFDEKMFKEALVKKNDEPHYRNIIDSYAGFSVLKPIRRSSLEDPSIKEKLIGRTVLKAYNEEIPDTDEKRCYIKTNNTINLYGINITIESLPFQAQDIAVGACATTSLWVVNHLYKQMFDIKRMSLFEITQKSNEYTELYRNFPSGGLTLKQVLTFLKWVGLDYEVVNIDVLLKNKEDEDDEYLEKIIPTTIKSYMEHAKIPIIAFIKDLGREDEYDQMQEEMEDPHSTLQQDEWESEIIYHTAVISGFRSDTNGNITELYVHDDGLGPYTRVESKDDNGSFIHWKRKFNHRTDIYEVMYLVVPIYPKIRMVFNKIQKYFEVFGDQFYEDLPDDDDEIDEQEFKWCFYLTTVQNYKRELLSNMDNSNNLHFLSESLPRFLWIFRLKQQNMLFGDHIFDATSVEIAPINKITY